VEKNMRSVNKVLLIGNLTRDPELKKTETGKSVCNFGLATNRNWTTDSGEKQEETDFHRIVAWGKLAELCNEYLRKGRLVYVAGRLQSHSWTDNEGMQKTATEIVIDEMNMLDSKPQETQKEVVKPDTNQQAATVS
jgi:single-strand DNA-binding protein